MILTRDRYPPFRVDLVELFSRWLTPVFDIEWVMARGEPGRGGMVGGAPGERFWISDGGLIDWFALQARQSLRIMRGEVDLVQVRDAALSAAWFLMMARIGRRPFVYWMSYPMVEGYRHRAERQVGRPLLVLARRTYAALAGWLLYRWVLPRAVHLFVQSERMKTDVAVKGVPTERITAVPMAVSIGVYDPQTIDPAEDDRLLSRKVLIYVGAMDVDRDIALLVQAMAKVALAGFDTVLVLVGTVAATDQRRIERAAERVGVRERVLFTGHQSLGTALRYVKRADVCLAPFPVTPETYLSATPTKLVEYLAMGRPVVATDHPDQRQVIQGSGAGVIAPATADGLASAIVGLLRDPVEAERIGARGPAWVAAHRDYAVISGHVRSVYQRLLTVAA